MSFVILKTSILFHFYNLGIIVNGYYVIDKTYELLYSLFMVRLGLKLQLNSQT